MQSEDSSEVEGKMPSDTFGLHVNDVDIVLYHGEGCPDGIGGAFAFYLYNNKATLVSCLHTDSSDRVPHSLEGRVVVAVDFSFPVEMTRIICSQAKYFVVLDHHASAQRNLTGLPGTPGFENFDYIFDMDRSGAQIAWDWVHREGGKPNPVPTGGLSHYPWFIDVIAARDLWRWDMYPHSKSLGKAMHLLGYYTWEKMYEMIEEITLPDGPAKTIERLRSVGDPMVESEKRSIDKAIEHSILVEFEGYRVRLGHCESHLRSEVGNGLCNMDDCLFSATWRYDYATDQWWISLRGNDDTIETVDLSMLVGRYSGGGHPKACGFAIHGQRSEAFTNAHTDRRRSMAHGNLHDYFKAVPR